MIFMDLHKVYDTLDRDIFLEILEGCVVGTRAHHIHRHYWYRLEMVAFMGRHYGEAFRGFQGVTQGDTLSLTIFIVVVDEVVRKWASLMAGVI